MTKNDIKSNILLCKGLFGFQYNEKEGNIDPYYIPEKQSYKYLLAFDGDEQFVYDIDAVMNTPFINGQSLNDVAEKITITEY